MAESKYGKYILRDTGSGKPVPAVPAVVQAALTGRADWCGIQHRIDWKYITQPILLDKVPHTHDYEEFLCFLGSDPGNPQDFGAEIEISLGDEGEKHNINAASVVCIPRGLKHGPLDFKKTGRPVLFCDIYLSPEYESREDLENG